MAYSHWCLSGLSEALGGCPKIKYGSRPETQVETFGGSGRRSMADDEDADDEDEDDDDDESGQSRRKKQLVSSADRTFNSIDGDDDV